MKKRRERKRGRPAQYGKATPRQVDRTPLNFWPKKAANKK